jgi:hypothetical protein
VSTCLNTAVLVCNVLWVAGVRLCL